MAEILKTCFLYPGQLVASAEPMLVTTILGSCVGVVFHDRKRKIGGVCHYLLDLPGEGERPSARYGAYAVQRLYDDVLLRGAQADDIQAKIYGGAAIIGHSYDTSIGARNVEFARKFCRERRIPVLEETTGGFVGCKIEVNTETFEVRHRFNEKGSKSLSIANVEAPAATKKRVKVLVVDDSATVRQMFSQALAKFPMINVVGVAVDAHDAREKIVSLSPDVLTLDIEMPKLNGVQFLEKLMIHHPMPVIMVSSLGAHEAAALRALELGAVEFVHKPAQFDPTILRDLGTSLADRIMAAASLSPQELKNRASTRKPTTMSASSVASAATSGGSPGKRGGVLQIIGIGGNAGSADALTQVLTGLQNDTPPVLVSVSTITGFLSAFIEKNRKSCPAKIVVAEDGAPAFMGHVYLAPPTHHLGVVRTAGGAKLRLTATPPIVHSQRPSASVLFADIAREFGPNGCCVLLSGFGNDGVEGLLRVRNAGGTTVVQHPETASFQVNVAAAIEEGAADFVLTPAEIGPKLRAIRSERVIG